MLRNKSLRHFFSIILISTFAITSCNSISKKDLKVIDDIQLGSNVNEYDSLLSTLNIEKETFLTKIFFPNYNFSSNSLNFPFTKDFDFSNYGSERNRHLGLFYPTLIAGTDKIISLAVIIVHTERPTFVLPVGMEPQDVGNEYRCISQHISSKVVDAIENMYISKYGKPKDTITESMFIKVYKIERAEVKSYRPPEIKGVCQQLVWETKYLRIKLFKGIPSTDEEKYDTKTNRYKYTIGTNDLGNPEIKKIEVDFNNGETMCEAFPYIEYELKQEVIDKLKLDKKKI